MSLPIPASTLDGGSGARFEVAPGKRIPVPALPGPAEATPLRYVLAEVVPLGGGTFRLVPRPVMEWMGLSQAALAKVGITLSENTLRRLGRAGFIRVRPVSPNRYEFNFTSWLEHCRRVEADPEEFWDRRENDKGRTNREKYLAAL
ncbi:hypothetical protein [Horticoccus sp. 23ND18S-11]|uniref:hypothetical protein n=1 Tax=Horticoccus sp. 23ND18S-11 TaxID=3391832 RepID=UPI0039C9B4B0